MASVPEFEADGVLPPGDYEATFEELRKSILVAGPTDKLAHPNWDSGWRSRLVDHLEILTTQLWQVGVTDVFANGSFVEDKDHPNDIDGYFNSSIEEFATGDLQRKLNLLDPYKVWSWDPRSRRPYRGYAKWQLPMWHVYRVEFYPHYTGLNSGIRDEHGNELEFPAAFRKSRRDDRPKGIIKLKK